MISKDKNEKLVYISIIKIIACVMVILNHISGMILRKHTVLNTSFYCAIFSICKIGVPLFLMSTGMLLLDKEYNYKKVFKCIIRISVPTILVSLCLYINGLKYNRFSLLVFLKNLIVNPYEIHLWYIYLLIGIYLTIPFIQKLVKNFKEKDYIIFILIFLIMPSFINMLKALFNVQINSSIMFPFFSQPIAMLICGSYMSKINKSKKLFYSSICVLILFFLAMFSSMFIPTLYTYKISYKFDSWNTLLVLAMSIPVFYIIRYIFEDKKISKKKANVINTIASTTFGIYLIHLIIKNQLIKLNFINSFISYNPILGVMLLLILVFIISLLITYVLKKIPILKKFL